jgi:hypothetical protein
MITLPAEVKATDYLTWEYCSDPDIQYLDCPAPAPMRNFIPQWFKDQKSRKQEIDIAQQQTIRNCLGFRGLANIGYSIPLPETLMGHETYFNRGRLHPDMLYGTKWANKGDKPWAPRDSSLYEYYMRLLHWPWRARMAPGWRLLILPYLMDWSSDWNEFAGAVEPNYHLRDGTGIGTGLKWAQTVDTRYNYYNLETVIAFRRGTTVEKGTVTFCAVPLYDPTLPENAPLWQSWTDYQPGDRVYFKDLLWEARSFIARAPQFQMSQWGRVF